MSLGSVQDGTMPENVRQPRKIDLVFTVSNASAPIPLAHHPTSCHLAAYLNLRSAFRSDPCVRYSWKPTDLATAPATSEALLEISITCYACCSSVLSTLTYTFDHNSTFWFYLASSMLPIPACPQPWTWSCIYLVAGEPSLWPDSIFPLCAFLHFKTQVYSSSFLTPVPYQLTGMLGWELCKRPPSSSLALQSRL